jgi:hypothetical protein
MMRSLTAEGEGWRRLAGVGAGREDLFEKEVALFSPDEYSE